MSPAEGHRSAEQNRGPLADLFTVRGGTPAADAKQSCSVPDRGLSASKFSREKVQFVSGRPRLRHPRVDSFVQ